MNMMVTGKSHLQKRIAVAVDNVIFQASKASLIVVAEVKFLIFELKLGLLDFYTPVRFG
jgi:hypothetical protein